MIQKTVQLEPLILQNIVDHAVKALKPLKIILFGSRAEGRALGKSDIDLLVVLDSPIDRMLKHQIANRLSEIAGVRVQLILMLVEQFEETKDIIGGIAYPANKYGVVIYEKS